jgi:predicted DNA-binding transcriptional regulator YafY
MIGTLRQNGATIDQILDKLRELDADVSRSALGRHVHHISILGERIRRSREVAQALVENLGDAPESRQARLNIETMHSIIMDMFAQTGDDGQPLTLDPESALQLSRALQALASARKTDADAVLKIRQEATKQAATAAESVAKARGLSAETVQAIRANILGIAQPQ